MSNEPWIQTYMGKQVFPFCFRTTDVDIQDIAHSLSLLCRFQGHCNKFYSVAEHSVRVSDLLPQELKLCGLLHDAAEAYLGDAPKPLKQVTNLMNISFSYREYRIMMKIAAVYDLDYPFDPRIKQADRTMLATEKRYLMSPPPAPWLPLPPALNEPIVCTLSPAQAENEFLCRFFILTAQRRHEREFHGPFSTDDSTNKKTADIRSNIQGS